MIMDHKGRIWLGTDGGLSVFDGTYFTHYTTREGLPGDKITAVFEDSKGNIWIGTNTAGVAVFDGQNFTQLPAKDNFLNTIIWCINEDHRGNIWFGTNGGGAYVYNGTHFVKYTTTEGLSDNYIWSLIADHNGNMWIGTSSSGVTMFDGQQFTVYSENEGLSNKMVRTILEDKCGNIWMGTNGGGLNIYNGNGFTHFTEKEGLSHFKVLSMTEDHQGNVWLGTNGGGVSIMRDTVVHHLTETQGLLSNNIISLTTDHQNRKWLSTWGRGVQVYDGKTFTNFGKSNGLTDERCTFVLHDRKGNTWLGTQYSGIAIYDGKTFKHFTEKEGLSSNNIRYLLEDSKGNIWICTHGGGVSVYDGKNITHFTEREGISDNLIWMAHEDQHHNIWFATEQGGVSVYDGKQFTHITEKEGLPVNMVWSVLEEKSGNIWLSTEKGLVYITPLDSSYKGDRKTAIKVTTFSKYDGLSTIDFFWKSALIDQRNYAWWGDGKGLLRLPLNDFNISENVPAPRLNRIDINESYIDYLHFPDSLTEEIRFDSVVPFFNYPSGLDLSFNTNHLTFHFIGIDWKAPHKIKYRYQLKGLDREWGKVTTSSYAEYRNIPPGDFTFRVSAMGESQVWSKPFEYSFKIHPPWWQSKMAYTGYGLLLIVSYLGSVHWNSRRLRQRARQLEDSVNKATIEIVHQRDEIQRQRDRSDELLENILPAEIATELKENGTVKSVLIENVTVLFTDFKGFTAISGLYSPEVVVNTINHYFTAFDKIVEQHGVEKLKTIGDSYMLAGGIPKEDPMHAIKVVNCALEILGFVRDENSRRVISGEPYFEIRIGIHTGTVVAGIVGVKKFAYDIWGDTVNLASRIESSGEAGKVNISSSTYALVKDKFHCVHRGKIEAKNKGEIDMYFVEGRNRAGL
ncbi:MAG: hypothetical protein IPN36_15650 [Bacteroidetes bacterium]|nr:hypothetical protein [Bacteroidota bacterium]